MPRTPDPGALQYDLRTDHVGHRACPMSVRTAALPADPPYTLHSKLTRFWPRDEKPRRGQSSVGENLCSFRLSNASGERPALRQVTMRSSEARVTSATHPARLALASTLEGKPPESESDAQPSAYTPSENRGRS